MNNQIEMTVHFRASGQLNVDEILNALHTFSTVLASASSKLTGWLLKGKSKTEAFLYDVFDEIGPTSVALAVLNEKLKNEIDPRIVSIWNGHDDDGDGASIKFVGRLAPAVSLVTLNTESDAFTGDWKVAVEVMKGTVQLWNSSSISFETNGYVDRKVFKDRPSVGWMLYLPIVLTTQQVPEARALVPVMGKDEKGKNKQIGTIIVSVTDAPFSDENPEHVAIANAIEIRLVDQDLLPRYADF